VAGEFMKRIETRPKRESLRPEGEGLPHGPDEVGFCADTGDKEGEGMVEKDVPGLSCGEAPDPEDHFGGALTVSRPEDAQDLDPLFLVEESPGENLVNRALVEEAMMQEISIGIIALDDDPHKKLRGAEKMEDEPPAFFKGGRSGN